jgi:hypothetical protein
MLGIHSMSLGIGEAACIEDLQEEVKHLWMSLLDLIQQHNTMRATAKFARQLALLVIANIARWGTDHA